MDKEELQALIQKELQNAQNLKEVSKTNPLIKYLFMFLIIVIAGMGAYIYFNRDSNKIDSPKDVVQETATVSTKTSIGYVPKSEVINPITGKKELEKTDMEANIQKPAVSVRINGKESEFKLIQGESQKFEKGKVVLDQVSKVELEIKVPEKKESLSFGPYIKVSQGNGVSTGLEAEYQNKKLNITGGYDSKEKGNGKFRYDVVKF